MSVKIHNRAMMVVNFNNVLLPNARASMVSACERWGVYFKEVTPENWRSVNSPPSIKSEAFMILPANVEDVMILDADTVVSEWCPNPFTTFDQPDELVAVVNNRVEFGDTAGILAAERQEWGKCQQYFRTKMASGGSKMESLQHGDQPYFNTGMVIARRAHHEGLFTMAYELCLANLGLGWGEQTPLNYYAAAMGTRMHYAPPAWNLIHADHLLHGDWLNMAGHPAAPFIYHFAGTSQREKKIAAVRWKKEG